MSPCQPTSTNPYAVNARERMRRHRERIQATEKAIEYINLRENRKNGRRLNVVRDGKIVSGRY